MGIEDPSIADLLKDLRIEDYPSVKIIHSVKGFIQTVLYGKTSENYIQTRISKFQMLGNKSSSALHPDESSITQVILRAHLQVYIRRRCTQIMMDKISYEDLVADEKEMVIPIWFTNSLKI